MPGRHTSGVLTMHDGWLLLQVNETGGDLGPGLQAALRSFGTALDKLPTIQIRSPSMYSLVHSSMVRTAAQVMLSRAHPPQFAASPLCLVLLIWTLCMPQLTQDEVPLNLRASWLAGRPIRGDVLLSKIRLRPHQWGQPSVRWGSFTLDLLKARSLLAPAGGVTSTFASSLCGPGISLVQQKGAHLGGCCCRSGCSGRWSQGCLGAS